MLNQVVLVGRIANELEIVKEGDNSICKITIAIPRSFKNVNGEYDTDFVSCTLMNSIAENTAEYCKKGDIVGVKGRIEGDINKGIAIIAEKVTFLSSRSQKEED